MTGRSISFSSTVTSVAQSTAMSIRGPLSWSTEPCHLESRGEEEARAARAV